MSSTLIKHAKYTFPLNFTRQTAWADCACQGYQGEWCVGQCTHMLFTQSRVLCMFSYAMLYLPAVFYLRETGSLEMPYAGFSAQLGLFYTHQCKKQRLMAILVLHYYKGLLTGILPDFVKMALSKTAFFFGIYF